MRTVRHPVIGVDGARSARQARAGARTSPHRVAADGALDRPCRLARGRLARRDTAEWRRKLSTGRNARHRPGRRVRLISSTGAGARGRGDWSAAIEWLVKEPLHVFNSWGVRRGSYPLQVWSSSTSAWRRRAEGQAVGAPRIVLLGSRWVARCPSRLPTSGCRGGHRLAPGSPISSTPTLLGAHHRTARAFDAASSFTDSASLARKGYERARERGAEGRYELIPGAFPALRGAAVGKLGHCRRPSAGRSSGGGTASLTTSRGCRRRRGADLPTES